MVGERSDEQGVVLYRIGRAPDPLSAPPPELRKDTGNRFDDPKGEFWVMYAAEQRRACFAETLARFRVHPELLARLDALPDGDAGNDAPDVGVIPDDFHLKRMMGSFRVVLGQLWLDLRSLAVRERIRRELAGALVQLGRDDFDLSDALSRDRTLTRTIARWAYDNGHQGIIYTSRFDSAFDCWALFEGALFEPIDRQPIASNDNDLIAVARLFRLRGP